MASKRIISKSKGKGSKAKRSLLSGVDAIAGTMDDCPVRFASINALVDRQKPRAKTKRTALKSASSQRLEAEIRTDFRRRIQAVREELTESDEDDEEEHNWSLFGRKRQATAEVLEEHEEHGEHGQDEEHEEEEYQQEKTIFNEEIELEGSIQEDDSTMKPMEEPENTMEAFENAVDMSGFTNNQQGYEQEEDLDNMTLDFDDLDAPQKPPKKSIRHPEFKDYGNSLVPPGQYSCPPPTSRYKGLLMAAYGEPAFCEDFERQLKASVARCLPDTSLKWLSEDCVDGKKSLLREMIAAFGEGLSREYILKRACHIMESRRSNHRRRAAQGLPKPVDLSEAAWRVHLAHTTSTKHREARQKQRIINRLGSGGWASLCHFCVKEWGFVPSEALKKKAIEKGAALFIAALKKKNLPPRNPSKSDAEIWAEYHKKSVASGLQRKRKQGVLTTA